MKVFFKCLGIDAPVFSIELPDNICLGMLHPILEVYLRLKKYALNDMLLAASDRTGQALTGCIVIQISDAIPAEKKQTFAISTLSSLARFCASYEINKTYFYYVRVPDNGDEYYRPNWRLKDALTAYVEQLQEEAEKRRLHLESKRSDFESDVFDVLRNTLNESVSLEFSLEIVKRMLSRLEEDTALTVRPSLGAPS